MAIHERNVTHFIIFCFSAVDNDWTLRVFVGVEPLTAALHASLFLDIDLPADRI